MRVFVTGGTGMIGARLIRALRSRGDEVVALSRRADAWTKIGQDVTVVVGDPQVAGDWQAKLAECDAVVNLAGESLFSKRWNNAFKRVLRDSRVNSTANVVEALKRAPLRADGSPKVLVNGSAIGYYGYQEPDVVLTESSPPSSDFMASLCIEWELAAKPVEAAGVRLAYVRTGVVLDKLGGALSKLLFPFSIGAGGPVGMSLNPADWGRQIMSWIHHQDEIGIILLALDHPEAKGPINATAPNPVSSKQFGQALGAAMNRPSFNPTPAIALRIALGEVADVVTKGQKVLPEKGLKLGYQFHYPDIGPALKQIIKEG